MLSWVLLDTGCQSRDAWKAPPTLRLEKLHKQAGDGERMGRTEVSAIGFSTVELMMTLMRGFGRAEGAHT